MKKVFIATSRPIGEDCIRWARQNLPPSFTLINDMEDSDIIISVLYEKLISGDILKGKTCFNFHPGILPEYRGAGAYSWSLINSEEKAGITLHLLDNGIDDGDIIEIREFLISSKDTAYSLCLRGTKLIYKMFKDWFEDLLKGNYEAHPQSNKNMGLYLRKDLHKAKDLTRYIRAFYFPGKEGAFYLNNSGDKVYLNFEK